GGKGTLGSEEGACGHEPLVTLGDSIALCRQWTSASGFAGKKFDVGAWEREAVILVEVDAEGRRRATEVFAPNHLGAAVARLCARYAELLPDGPARTRAAATARSVAAMTGPFDLDRYATAMGPSLEFVDHRSVVGIGSTRGAAAYLKWLHTLFDVADDVVTRLDDVLGLRSELALVRRTTSGTERASGGPFERQLLQLWVFGTDGGIEREEHFDVNRSGEALARFDELAAPEGLTAEPAAVRRGRPNAATRHAARFDAAIVGGDAQALPGLFAEDMSAEDHLTHTAWDRKVVLSSWRSLVLAQDPTCRHQPLATLGDSLALCHVSLGASRLARGRFDVGGYR